MREPTSILFAILLTAPLAAAAAEPTSSVSAPAQAGFERLKALAGDWRELNEPHRLVSYRVISRGSVVQEEFNGERSMSTFYHLDGNDLFLTHYCSAGNQPRMRSRNPDPGSNRLSFRFEDVTNLRSPEAYFTHDLEIVFEDADHVELHFTGQKAGRLEAGTPPVRLERVH